MKFGKLEIDLKSLGLVYDDWYYVYLFNWLRKRDWYWGREDMYCDGPHRSFGFWFFNISWRSPWTPWPEYMVIKEAKVKQRKRLWSW